MLYMISTGLAKHVCTSDLKKKFSYIIIVVYIYKHM